MSEARLCPQCDHPLPDDAPMGVCPTCVLDLGLGGETEEPVAETSPLPKPRTGTFVAPRCADLASHFPELELIELVGQGGMGAVYKARQISLDRIVALKLLPEEIGDDQRFAERFAREARALARLTHPNIVMIFEYGTKAGYCYFVMEFVDGVNLRETLREGNLQPEEALAIVPQICDALQFAHEEGIVHRDIKPENVLIDKRGRVKIADFGLAKLIGHSVGDRNLTGTRQVMGTPHYMAPEQMEKPQTVDHRADIYSLGVVFYELLTGELPLGRFEPPSRVASVDAELDQVVMRSLEKEPSRRFQKVSEVRTAVETYTKNKPPVADERLKRMAAEGAASRKRPLRVPFKIQEFYGGLAEATGLLRFDGDRVSLEFQVQDGVLGVAKSGVKEVTVELDDIVSVDYTRGFFKSGKIIFQADSMSVFANLPASENGQAVLVIQSRDTPKAEHLVEAIQRRLADEPWEYVLADIGHTSEISSSLGNLRVDLTAIRRNLRGPATGLLVIGLINVLVPILTLCTFAIFEFLNNTPTMRSIDGGPMLDSGITPSIVMLLVFASFFMFSVPIGGVQILAALRMYSLRSYGLGITGGVLALLPVQLAWLAGIPIGLGVLTALLGRHTRAAFVQSVPDGNASAATSGPPQKPVPMSPQEQRRTSITLKLSVGGLLIVAALVAVLIVGTVAMLVPTDVKEERTTPNRSFQSTMKAIDIPADVSDGDSDGSGSQAIADDE